MDLLSFFCLVFAMTLRASVYNVPLSWLSFVVSNCELSLTHWYPWSAVVLDCIDS